MDLFKDYVPPIRRIPSILWYKLLYDIRNIITYNTVDGKSVIMLNSNVFEKELKQRYLASWVTAVGSRVKNLMIEYFTGSWSEDEKPFKFFPNQQKMLGLKKPESSAPRYVPRQPTITKFNVNGIPKWHINTRKVRMLASVLYSDALYWDNEEALFRFMRLVPFNFEMLIAILIMGEWQLLMMILQIRQVIDDEDGDFEKRQVIVYTRCLASLKNHLTKNPSSLMIHLVGQLLGNYNFLTHPSALIRQADKEQGRRFCALICTCQQIPVAGEVQYLEATRHHMPVTNCCFLGNTMFSVSDKLVGISFDNYGNSTDIVTNARIPGIPEGDYFNFMMVVGMDNQNDVIQASDTEKMLLSAKIVLALHFQPKVFMINALDGKVLFTIDCGKDIPDNQKQSQISSIQIVSASTQDFHLHVTIANGLMVLVYSCHTGKFLYTMSSQDNNVLDVVQMEDGCFCALLQNGDITVLDNIQGYNARNMNNTEATEPLSILKNGNDLRSWNQGKWGAVCNDVLIMGVESGHLMAYFGVNPIQSQTHPPISASVKLPDQSAPHFVDTDVKGLRTRVALALVCTENWIHLVKFEVGRNKQCSTTLAASMKKKLEEALLFEDVIVGRHLNAIFVGSCGNQGDGSYSIKRLAVLDIHTSSINVMRPSAIGMYIH